MTATTEAQTVVGRSAGGRQQGMVETIDIGAEEWLNFVNGQDDATPFHHPAWARVVSGVYGFRPEAVVLRSRAGTIAAGLPAICVPGLSRRRRWKCLPFTDHCEPLGEEEYVSTLMNSLQLRADENWEVRAAVPALGAVRAVAVTHRLDLRPGLDAIHAGFHRSQVRRALRKANRDRTVEVREASERSDLTEVYYELHVATRKRQGVPPQPRRLFGAIWDELHTTGLASTHLAEIQGEPVAGAVFLHWNGVLVYKYGASRADTWKAHPNHVIFWRAIQKACAEGMRELDFGLSDVSNHGLRAFKSNWGAREEELQYSFSRRAAQPRSTRHSPARVLLAGAIRRSPPRICEWIGTALYRFAA